MQNEKNKILTTFEELQNLKEVGLYDRLMKKGIISLSVNLSLEIHNYFNTRMIVNQEFSNKKFRSYEETMEAFNCSEMTVRRSIKLMNS
jgi:hypothetical protein